MERGEREGGQEHGGHEGREGGRKRARETSQGLTEAGSYKPREEARRAGEKTVEIITDAHERVNELRREHEAEVNQTPGLSEAIDRLTAAVEALSRTVAALVDELQAGRSGDSLAPVALIQKPVADGEVEEAISRAAAGGPVRKILGVIKEKLTLVGKWLWSMLIQLVTIRQWSLGGKVHVPGFAEASLTVTFGKAPDGAVSGDG